ncbi:MAG: Mg2 transporter protein CorA family protein [Gemmatimonadetes bacterium]|nr:Mg2 transporter protein CorA family protein [Gemmatimonadota bacterium]
MSPRASRLMPRSEGFPRSWWTRPDGTLERDLPADGIVRVIAEKDGQLWVEVDAANREQMDMLESVFHFHPLSIEDSLNPQSRVKVEEYPAYLFVIIRGVRFFQDTSDPYDLETFNISFFLGPNFLVTVHGGQSSSIALMADTLERNPELLRRGAERLMHAVMDNAVDAYFPLLDQIEEFLDGLEERVFQQFDEGALRDIFSVKRLVLTMRRHLAPQREVFNVLSNRPNALLAPEAQVYFRDIYDHVLRINDTLEAYRELLSSTLDSYLTQVSNRLGMVTKGLTVVATVSIPFVVISGMWGMNVQNIPFATHPHAFWWMLGLQLSLGAMLMVYLRKRGMV